VKWTEELRLEKSLDGGKVILAEWIFERHELKVLSFKSDKFTLTMGYFEDGVVWLSLLEGVYLTEMGYLEIYEDKIPLSILQCYELLAKENIRFEDYLVYSSLLNDGYILLEYTKEIETKYKFISSEKQIPVPINFLVYLPNKNFRKKELYPPKYFLSIFSLEESVPNWIELSDFVNEIDINLLFCINHYGTMIYIKISKDGMQLKFKKKKIYS